MATRILLVDDNAIIRFTYEVVLRRAGFEVDSASDVDQALEMLAPGHDYHVVVSDLNMPGKSGQDLVTILRETPANQMLPVLMLTGSKERCDVIANLNAGVSDYVTKEPDKAVFLARVRNLVKMKQLQDELAHASQTDALTGLANRRHGCARLEEEMSRSRRYERGMTVALLDIDHFKRINDTLGHHAGDDVLVAVSERLQAASRQTDCVIRWGGEEFLFLFPETDLDEAAGIVDRLRADLAANPVDATAPEGLIQVDVTVSGGVAQLEAGDTLESLVDRADKGLYAAKENGRNRLLVSRDGELEPVAA
ncbi:MAG: diguanylate cyclase response regulator [Planctomycetota bacterium]|nr:MAG: diguanylate cyclase response regulator [Planctomycetota bacterium]